MSSAENYKENSTPEEIIPLIDIFYKDTDRIYSLMSQSGRGAWQEQIITQGKTQKADVLSKSNLGFTRAFGSEFSSDESEEINRSIQTKKLPFDDIVLGLLEELGIEPRIVPPGDVSSRIDVLHGTMRLQNYKMMSSIFPLLKQYPRLFIEEYQAMEQGELQIQALRAKKRKTPEEIDSLRELEKIKKHLQKSGAEKQAALEAFSSLYNLFPSGIGFELSMEDGAVFSGQLKPDNLTDSEEIIFTNYGELLPGEWNVLGIIDYQKDDDFQNDDDDPMKMMAQFSGVIKKLLSKRNITGTIIPILIYRELNFPDNI